MKRFLFLGFVSLILFSLFAITFAQTDYGELVLIDSYSFNPSSVYPGDTVSVNVNLKNRGNAVPVEDVNASISLGSGFEEVTYFDHLDFINYGTTETASFRFKVKESTSPGTYKIPLLVEFLRQTSGSKNSIEFSFPLTVEGISSIDIKNIVVSNYSPHIGDNVTISASVQNIGELEAREVIIELVPASGKFEKVTPKTETSIFLDNILPGDSKNVSFELYLPSEMDPGVFEYALTSSALEANTLDSETVVLSVKDRPNIIVSGVDFSVEGRDGSKVLVGDTFALSVQLDNIGKENAKAVEVLVDTGESIIGSKQAYVGTIDADDSGSAIFDFVATQQTVPGNKQILLTISYIDEFDNKQEMTSSVDLYIHETPPESPVTIIVLLIVVLVLVYLIMRLVLGQLKMRKVKIK